MQKETGEGCQGDGNPPTPEREGRYYDTDVTTSFLVPFDPKDHTAPYPFASSPCHREAESAAPINRGRPASTREAGASRGKQGMKASGMMARK
jgi:hypothetical protein